MSSQDSAYHTQSQGASTPNSEMPDSGIKDGSFDDSIKMNSSTINGYNSMANHKIISDGHLVSKLDSSVKISEHKHSNSSSHHNSDHVKKKEGDLHKHSSSSLKHKDEVNKINESSNSISSKEHNDKKHEHSKSDTEKLKKDKSSSEKSHHDSSKKIDKHHEDKHREKPKDGHSSSGHSEHKHKEHKSKERDKLKEHDKSKHNLSKEHDKSKHNSSKEHDKSKHNLSKEHDKSKYDSSKDKLKKIEGHKEKHGEKPKEKSDKPKDKSDKPKDKSDKPKDKSDKPKEKLDKPKERTDKPKEKSDKPKEKSIEKHKERSVEKHKERSEDKHKEKSENKHKEKSEDKHKEKGDHKHKDGDKLKDKHKEKSDKPKDKIDKPKDKTDKIDKPKEKSDKPKEKSEKPKEKSDKPKEKSDKHKIVEKSKEKSINIKKESSPLKKSPQVKEHSKKEGTPKPKVEMSITVETIDTSQIKLELDSSLYSSQNQKEEYFSEDDIPLSARKPVKEEKPVVIKREIEESEELDDEPLSARISKTKKIKTEPSSAKKRKAEESDYDNEDYGDDYADEDYDSDYKKPSKKKVKKEIKPKKTPAKKTTKKVEPSTPTASPVKKGRAKKAEQEQEVWKWWEEEKHEDGVKWRTLEHKGPVFAPDYERVPKNVKFFYDGKQMQLSEVTEEVAGFYGRMLDHDYTTKDSFNKNFFKDWKKVMTAEERETITDLKKCNFNDFNNYYKLKSEERKAMTKEQKQEIKKQNEALVEEYGFCVIDGHRQKIGNFKIEPPGLFRGRGEHPKMGMLKRRVQAEDISINIGKEAKIPEAPKGHKWKDVRHDNTVTWLVSWTENILGSTKYIMLNPSSKLKGEKDWQKYETARKLKNYADEIRRTYSNDFKSKEMKIRQRAVALYFIDKLALRAGNEKDEDTADTVGCCSLRVEHITMDEEKDGQQYVVSFDFLGKDSIRYFNSVPVEKRAYKNLKLFMENKQPGDDLFDRLNTSILNKYLNELMEGLTAKVFRTYNASKTLQEQLDLLTKEEMSPPEKLLAYNRANRAVAILCNHQRAVPKTFNKSMESLKTKIDDKIQQIRACKKDLKQLKSDAKNSGNSKDRVLTEKKKKRLSQLEDQLKKLEVQATDKEENKQIALGTSKLNYLDPRISVAWCKKWDIPIEKIYNKSQRDKFRWAIEMAGPDFKF